MRWKADTYRGWGRALAGSGTLARPERVALLADIAKEETAPAIGNRRSYGDACIVSDGRAIDMTRLDRILEFDADTGMVHTEAGCQIGDLLRAFAPRGWLPPVMPGTGFATVGGAIAMDVHGKNHHHAGSFGQHVHEITLMTPDGPLVITKDDNRSLFKATIGGLGQTGPILSARFKLLKAKGDVMIVTERRVSDWNSFIRLLDASDATYSVGWIDATARGLHLGRGILEEAETGAGLIKSRKSSRKVPFNAPGFALSAPVVRAFNGLYWRRIPEAGRTVVKTIEDFFFPLDKLQDWNKLYGKTGFLQFQAVVPPDQVEALKTMLVKIANSGLASPLAVLKRMGSGRGGYMSFPMRGYTLAVDFRNTKGARQLLAELEVETQKIGGRVYLAKDATMAAETVKSMYPERQEWVREVQSVDPEGAYTTDLVRRLKLRADDA